MIFSPAFLSKSSGVGALSRSRDYQPGDFIARGFADLGVEVFCVIGAEKMVSLFSGQTSHLPEPSDESFFRVLESDELVAELIKLGAAVRRMEFIEQRSWVALVEREGELFEFQADSISEALLDAFISFTS